MFFQNECYKKGRNETNDCLAGFVTTINFVYKTSGDNINLCKKTILFGKEYKFY